MDGREESGKVAASPPPYRSPSLFFLLFDLRHSERSEESFVDQFPIGFGYSFLRKSDFVID